MTAPLPTSAEEVADIAWGRHAADMALVRQLALDPASNRSAYRAALGRAAQSKRVFRNLFLALDHQPPVQQRDDKAMTRPALMWPGAKAAFDAALAAERAFDTAHIAPLVTAADPGPERTAQVMRVGDAIFDASDRLAAIRCDAEEAMIAAEAPDIAAVLAKIEWARPRWREQEDWPEDWWTAVLADLRRLADPVSPNLQALIDAAEAAEMTLELNPDKRDDTPEERNWNAARRALDDYEPQTAQEFVRQFAAGFDSDRCPTDAMLDRMAVTACRLSGVASYGDRRFDVFAAEARRCHEAETAALASAVSSEVEEALELSIGALAGATLRAFYAAMRAPVTDGARAATKLDLMTDLFDDGGNGMDRELGTRVQREIASILRSAA